MKFRIEGKDQLQGKTISFRAALQKTEEARSLRILFLGETGVGKTPFARHSNRHLSELSRSNRPFEQVNCACLTPEYFQDTLFGHKKGAFTGALTDKAGLVELAQGGDLFLDEIGDMPLQTQVHLLTFLDNLEYYRLGDDRKRTASVRVMAATNRPLVELVEQGKFRKDLYSRLAQVVVAIPPLRERAEDIPLLAEYFLSTFSAHYGTAKYFSPQVLDALQRQSWEEGNIRELRDSVERMYWLSGSEPEIDIETLFLASPLRTETELFRPVAVPSTHLDAYHLGLECYLRRIEKQVLLEILGQYEGHRHELAKQLRTSRSTLYRKLKVHGISPKEH